MASTDPSGPDAATDGALMTAYAQGDQRAFRTLFDRYAPLLGRVMRRGLWSQVEARDLVQQTFLQLHRARHDYRPDQPLRPWLLTIALNVKRQHLRTVGRRREAPLGEEVEARLVAAPHDPVRADRARRLHAALATLPAGQREVIELHWLEGIGFQEIGRVVGASHSAVKVRAHRGYARLREALPDLMPEQSGDPEGDA